MVSNGSRNGHELVLGGQIDETETEGIEVAMVCEGSCWRLEVRLIRWGPGIGWYVQKRISLDAAESQMVRRALGRGEALAQSYSQGTTAIDCGHLSNASGAGGVNAVGLPQIRWGRAGT
jgi:hypothetical protein